MSAPSAGGFRSYGYSCGVPNCQRKRAPQSANSRCAHHNKQFIKNGDPLQKTVHLRTLRFHEEKAIEAIKFAQRDPLWIPKVIDPLRRNLEGASKDAAFNVKLYLDGKAMRKGERWAWFMLNGFHSQLTLDQQLSFWCAWQIMADDYFKDYFVSEWGYKYQIVRLVYKLSGVRLTKPRSNTIKSWQSSGHANVYLSRYCVEIVYDHLYGIFGSVGYHLNNRWNPNKIKQNYRESLLDFFSKNPPDLNDREKTKIKNQVLRNKGIIKDANSKTQQLHEQSGTVIHQSQEAISGV